MAKKASEKKAGKQDKSAMYSPIIKHIFFNHYKNGATTLDFTRPEIFAAAEKLGIDLPENKGDVLYSFRFRKDMPEDIRATATTDREWVIKLAGKGKYRFELAKINRIVPTPNAYQIKIPDATPEIITAYAKTDEQALLAKVRYNRLIDIFLRVTAYSLQSHLRTSVPGVGQIEVDELYVGVRNTGQQFVIPVQAKGGTDQLGGTQIEQDLALCKHAFPTLTPRAVAVQFVGKEVIVMFELTFQGEDLKVVEERQYRLVPAGQITGDDLSAMANMSG